MGKRMKLGTCEGERMGKKNEAGFPIFVFSDL
jgi:hypothetical protein